MTDTVGMGPEGSPETGRADQGPLPFPGASLEGLFGALIDGAPDAIVIHDGETILYVNRRTLELIGDPPRDSVVGQSIWSFLPDLLHDELRARIEEMRRTGERSPVQEVPLEIPGYSAYWGEFVSSPMELGDGIYFQTVIRDATERKLAQQAKAESEARYRSLFDAVPVGLYRSRPDGTILDVNQAFVEILGYPDRETLLSRSTDDVYLDPTDRSEWIGGLDATTATVVPDVRLKRFDGEEVRVRLTVRVQYDADGAPSVFEGAAEDVTDSRRTQARFKFLFETMAQGVVFHDHEGRISVVNPAAERILGVSQEDLMGRASTGPEWEAYYPDGSPYPAEDGPVSTALRSGRPVRGAVLGIRNPALDEIRWIEMDTYPLFGPAGTELREVYAVFADVTERREAEEALRASEARMASMVQAAPVGITLSTLQDGMFLEVNEEFAELVGYPRDQLIGQSSVDLGIWVNVDDRKRAEEETAREGRLRGFPVQFRTREGDVRQVQMFTEVVDVGGERCALTMHQDVTDSRRLEEQLRQAQKMEAVGRLAGGIAHDFNNLLTALVGHVRFLLDGLADNDSLRQEVEGIRDGAERAERLTRQLLAFSRQQMLNPRLVDLREVLAGFGPLLRRLIGEDVILEISHGDPCWVRVDPNQLEQVLMNLAVNARDAMPDGGRLGINVECVDLDEPDEPDRGDAIPAGRYARLTVTDSGIGMDAETVDRIFDPFYTTKPTGQGTGLGLSTVYGIISQSSGAIRVDSAPGEGTTFTIFLPVVSGKPENLEPTAPDPGVTIAGGSERILLVEDEDAVRKLAARVLERAGYEVHTAADGTDALVLLREVEGVDLLITDMVMPGLSGRELAERVRDHTPALPVIYMSGYTADEAIRDQDQRAGTFLEKPFTPDQLVQHVRDALDA